MFWTGVFFGFAACLAIALTAHFVHERRQRSAFIASLTSPEREELLRALRQSRATGTSFVTYCTTISSCSKSASQSACQCTRVC